MDGIGGGRSVVGRTYENCGCGAGFMVEVVDHCVGKRVGAVVRIAGGGSINEAEAIRRGSDCAMSGGDSTSGIPDCRGKSLRIGVVDENGENVCGTVLQDLKDVT